MIRTKTLPPKVTLTKTLPLTAAILSTTTLTTKLTPTKAIPPQPTPAAIIRHKQTQPTLQTKLTAFSLLYFYTRTLVLIQIFYTIKTAVYILEETYLIQTFLITHL